MNYVDMKKQIEEMMEKDYKGFFKALVSAEKGVSDEKILDKVYEQYMYDDDIPLISDDIDHLIYNFEREKDEEMEF